MCGEGGEYETAVFDCPLFKKKIVSGQSSQQHLSGDDMAPVCTIHYRDFTLEEKNADDLARHAQIIEDRKAAVFNAFEVVEHEVHQHQEFYEFEHSVILNQDQ